MPTFTPPTSNIVPNLLADKDPNNDSPMKFFKLNPRGGNIFLLTNFTVTEVQPAYWTAWVDQNGTRWPGISKVWRGGVDNPISAEEQTLLIAAGYGAYIT